MSEFRAYRGLLGKGHPDYEDLDQGPAGAAFRQKIVLDALGEKAFKNRFVVDFGCGTGLILDHLAEREWLPTSYFGVDVISARAKHVYERCMKYRVHHRRVEIVSPDESLARFAELCSYGRTAICVGVAGYETISTWDQAKAVIEAMQAAGTYAITLPRKREFDGLGKGSVFDENKAPFGIGTVQVHEREIVVFSSD